MFNTLISKINHILGQSEPVHCFSFYKDEIISATTANKIGVHSGVQKAQVTNLLMKFESFITIINLFNLLLI